MSEGPGPEVGAAVGSLQGEAVEDAHVPEHNSPCALLGSLDGELGALETELICCVLV